MVHVWLVLGLASLLYVLVQGRVFTDRLDRGYVLALAPWLCLLGMDLGELGGMGGLNGMNGSSAPDDVRDLPVTGAPTLAAATRLTYQLMITGVAVFLSRAAGVRWRRGAVRATVFACVGSLIALYAAHAGMAGAWLWFNGLCGAVFVAGLLLHALSGRSSRGWMALLLAITGLSVILHDLGERGQGDVGAALHDFFFFAALFALWLALGRRLSDGQTASAPPPPGWLERRQLARDLHDGVGAQLVSIISALDAGTPQQRATAASLHHCLLELKLLVDGWDEDSSLVALLASLRYRMQPLMEATGVRLFWEMQGEQELEQIHGAAATHVMRLASEALANAIRHSAAGTICVFCGHERDKDQLLLHIADDGRGIAAALLRDARRDESRRRPGRGKGLSGMHQRARRIGGRLSIQSREGEGVRIQLTAPMAGLRTPRS